MARIDGGKIFTRALPTEGRQVPVLLEIPADVLDVGGEVARRHHPMADR